eukprot:12874313-Alexandrium_andersonii.AAC.1
MAHFAAEQHAAGLADVEPQGEGRLAAHRGRPQLLPGPARRGAYLRPLPKQMGAGLALPELAALRLRLDAEPG